MSNQQPFIHLDVHTQYSIQESKASIQRLVDKAIADGMRGMAVTDSGNMFGIKEFFNYVKSLKHKNPELDFTPILGCEVCCAHNSMKSMTDDDNANADWSLILLAKNEVGYHNLVKIVSHAWIDGFRHRPYTDHTELEKYHEGIIACSSSLDGEVVDYILKGQLNKAEASALWFKQVFGDDFYLELQRNEVSQQVNEELVRFAHKHNIKIIGTRNIHFVDKDDAKTSCPLANSDNGNNSKHEWFMTQSKMNELFADIPEALANTIDVLSKIENYDIDNAPILPTFTTSAESDDSYLVRLTYERAKAIYGDPLPENIAERLERELHVIVSMGYSRYFLIVQDYVNMARNELDVWVGPGRGNAAGSLVNYCLGITRIAPIKYDLLFERFINSNRICLPDIDVDFDEDGRSKVLQYISEKYGAENVAHIITFNTSSIEKPQHSTNSFEPVKKSDSQIIGTGIHACGIVICGDPIENHVPIATLEDPQHPEKRLRCTQYDGCVIEETGLVKFDLLPLEALSMLKETVKNIKATLGVDVDLDNIDLQDAETFKLYCEGRTDGTFLFGSEGMQKYLRELQPNTFEDLIALHALYRPGSMDYLPEFIDRKHGKKPIVYEIPCMERCLKNTNGLAIYQEQIMLLSQTLAGFTPDESDILYKALLKKKKEQLEQLKFKFVEQGSKNGHSQDSLEKVWANWEEHPYVFNKSHATCYTLLAFQTAYLKTHYPAEFSKALLKQWAREAIDKYDEIKNDWEKKYHKKWNHGFYNQSPLDQLTKQPEYFIIQFNPGSDGPYPDSKPTPEAFLEGNPCWDTRKGFGNIRNLQSLFSQVQGNNPLKDASTVFTNASFFNTLKRDDLPDEIWKKTLPITLQLAQIVQPKRIFVLSKKIVDHIKEIDPECEVNRTRLCPIIWFGRIHNIETIYTYHPSAHLREDDRANLNMQIARLIDLWNKMSLNEALEEAQEESKK